MMLHSVVTVASHPDIVQAGVIRVIRNAVIAVLLIAFFLGGFLGFLLGKAYGRRTRS